MPDSLERWLQRLEAAHPRTIELGLERVSLVWRRLGVARVAPSCFVIAGTNGKGSTAAYIDALVRGDGFKSGRYCSPHVLRFTERLVIDGQELSAGEWVAAFELVEAALDGTSLTYFEFTTLAAFILLSRAQVDCAVLEVGLGGRLDAVNIVDADCAVLTSIGLDHQEWLGPDRESIGHEKAGIMRGGRVVVCADRDPPRSVLSHAEAIGADLKLLGRDFRVKEGRLFIGAQAYRFPQPPQPGHHQRDNLAAAMAAVYQLYPGALENAQQVNSALSNVCLPGRLSGHLADSRVVIDVGHNPLAAQAVARYLEQRSHGGVFCVFAMLADKDAAGVVRALENGVDHWYCAGLVGARRRSGESLARVVRDLTGNRHVQVFEQVGPALESALKAAGGGDTVLVFGSFETAARALDVLDKRVRPGSVQHPSSC